MNSIKILWRSPEQWVKFIMMSGYCFIYFYNIPLQLLLYVSYIIYFITSLYYIYFPWNYYDDNRLIEYGNMDITYQ